MTLKYYFSYDLIDENEFNASAKNNIVRHIVRLELRP